VKDFYLRVDVAAGGWVDVPFGDMQDGQALLNISGIDCELSFDAGTVVMPLRATGAMSQPSWETHRRSSVMVRRAAGTGGGPLYVEVYAWRELR
jgi:hypothetical protein